MYVYIYVCVWPYVKLYAHARWYVMWEELSVNHFLKHSNHLKRTLCVCVCVCVGVGVDVDDDVRVCRCWSSACHNSHQGIQVHRGDH